ncbi:MAG: alpha/beta hydrolase [Bacteroidales bacterium]
MKRHIPLLILTLIVSSFTLIAVNSVTDDHQPCRKAKYATAEPGTCLDPKAYRFLKALDRVEQNPYDNEFAKRVIDFFEPGVHRILDTLVAYENNSVPVRIYYPTKTSTKTPTPLILFIHGGGFMFGSIEEYDMAVKKLARITGNIIISVDYSLAPDHPFPAALDDIYAVKDWIIQNRKKLGMKGDKITVMGDSAGGNLATVLSLRSRDENLDHILCQILYYPPTTFKEIEFPSRLYFLRDERRNYLLSEEFVKAIKTNYLPESVEDSNPYVSPLEADLTGNIPPVLIINAQVDPLRDEGRRYASKLSDAGQEVTYIEYDGMIHGFFNLYMIFKEGKESMKLVRNYIADFYKES